MEAPKDEKNTVTVTVAKKDTVTEAKKKDSKKSEDTTGGGKALDEAKEWYWDYDNNCWKECDPGLNSSDTCSYSPILLR